MASQSPGPTVVRVVKGLRGRVRMRTELVVRFDYGLTIPWVRKIEDGVSAVAGPDALYLHTEVPLHGEELTTVSEFEVDEGRTVPFVLTWHASHLPQPEAIEGDWAVQVTENWWRDWSGACAFEGEYREQVVRSLLVLKALTYEATGAIVAAPTTSLPEALGGERNWDYRYCWLRDAALSLDALMTGGYVNEAIAFAAWLARATALHPAQAQILYGIAGERRLSEETIDWLPGYEDSAPVRIGNAASRQVQLDVYGELLDAMHRVRQFQGRVVHPVAWDRQTVTLDQLESVWRQPDEGIWEVRGPRRHFTHSKVMAWVAFDRMIKAVEQFGAEGEVERWRQVRDEIHAEVCERGYDAERGTFTQYYGSEELDAATLLIPAVEFLPPDDPRVLGTIDAIQRELTTEQGFVLRYSTTAHGRDSIDGLKGKEGAFLPCSFWLADALAMAGRTDQARELFERLCGLANDVGLLSEEYDADRERLVGNFPQAFTHLALINTATLLRGFKSVSRPASEATVPGGA
jgi:GH15 family glucan-1,4-alpha-glucosidase